LKLSNCFRAADDESYIRNRGLALIRLPVAAGSRTFPEDMPSRVDEYETLLTENRIWIGRTKVWVMLQRNALLEMYPHLRGPIQIGFLSSVRIRPAARHTSGNVHCLPPAAGGIKCQAPIRM